MDVNTRSELEQIAQSIRQWVADLPNDRLARNIIRLKHGGFCLSGAQCALDEADRLLRNGKWQEAVQLGPEIDRLTEEADTTLGMMQW
jgi:hypothetical protein